MQNNFCNKNTGFKKWFKFSHLHENSLPEKKISKYRSIIITEVNNHMKYINRYQLFILGLKWLLYDNVIYD